MSKQISDLLLSVLGYGDWFKRDREIDECASLAVNALVKSMIERNTEKIIQVKYMISTAEIAKKAVAPRLKIGSEKIGPIRQLGKAGRNFFCAVESAVATWDIVHQNLAMAVKERKTVSIDLFVQAVVDVMTYNQRFQEL